MFQIILSGKNGGGGSPISERKIMKERRVERNTTCYSHLPLAPPSSLLSVRRCDIRAIRQGPGGEEGQEGRCLGIVTVYTLLSANKMGGPLVSGPTC